MIRLSSPPEATLESGFSGSPGLTEISNVTVSKPCADSLVPVCTAMRMRTLSISSSESSRTISCSSFFAAVRRASVSSAAMFLVWRSISRYCPRSSSRRSSAFCSASSSASILSRYARISGIVPPYFCLRRYISSRRCSTYSRSAEEKSRLPLCAATLSRRSAASSRTSSACSAMPSKASDTSRSAEIAADTSSSMAHAPPTSSSPLSASRARSSAPAIFPAWSKYALRCASVSSSSGFSAACSISSLWNDSISMRCKRSCSPVSSA